VIVAVAELDGTPAEWRTVREEGQLALFWRHFRKHKMAVASVGVLIVLILIALLAPYIAPYPRDEIVLEEANMAPGPTHWLGADELGRDILTRLIYAGRISLFVGFVATVFSELVGIVIGAVAGYYGRFVDTLLMRFLDFMLTIPLLPVLLVMSAILSTGGLWFVIPSPAIRFTSWLMVVNELQAEQVLIMIMILVFFGWLTAARLMRGMLLSLRERDFVDAARVVGASDLRIILRHMLPNAMAPTIVDATLLVGYFIILEAALSFLGFGIRPPTPTWGNMLSNVQEDMWLYPWKALYPGFCIFITSLCFNFVGDGLRDALDPRLRQ
jgi:peptide/nickel transport system permease protein